MSGDVGKPEIAWGRVAVLSAVAAAVPWLLALRERRRIEAECRESTRPRWTDANRWDRG